MADLFDPPQRKQMDPVNVEGDPAYKKHRIHVKRLPSGVFVVSVVHYTAKGSEVENLRGEYVSRDEAIGGARQHVDNHSHDE